MGSDSKACRTDIGLLVLRVGIGLLFLYHGFPKITGGVERWTELGQAMGNLGISFAPAFWGFMAAIAEFGGGLALILGILTRPFAGLLLFTMVVAVTHVLNSGRGMSGAAYAIAMAVVFLSLAITGAGAYSLDQRLRRRGCACGCGCACGDDATPKAPVAP